MATLLRLTQDAQALEDLILDAANEDGEIPMDATIGDWERETGIGIEEKLESIARLMREWDHRAKARRAEAKSLVEGAAHLENKGKSLAEYVKRCLEALGHKRFTAGLYEFSIAQNGGVAPLVVHDMGSLPAECFDMIPKPKNDMIRELVEAGKIPFEVAEIMPRGESLRIK